MSAPPRLPDRRPTNLIPDPDDIPDEPPPAYEPTPTNEQTLEYGPLRPFQPAPPVPSPPQVSHPRPPSHPALSPPPQRRPSRSHRYQPPNAQYQEPDRLYQPPPTANGGFLPPPTFPFWNGSSLTPAQTGFQEGPSLALFGSAPPPPGSRPPLPPPALPPRTPSSSNSAPSNVYEPTTTPTPGQPLLNDGRLLVFPVGEQCHKCGNTGYKPFGATTGYQGDDPSHPCRKCWQKYGKPYTSILKHSTRPIAPANYQRPLRLLSTPGQGGTTMRPPIMFTNQRPHLDVLRNSLVVRPGDPRIGGVLCRACGGDGLQMSPFIFDEVTCTRCMGTGRVF
ncbi:Hua1p [Sporobolomyces salmoneus]|uniref:Hua1p n=1 Tax=Sporobolomyces salmoneus TaxID=183962 RepID=UPI0031763FBB